VFWFYAAGAYFLVWIIPLGLFNHAVDVGIMK